MVNWRHSFPLYTICRPCLSLLPCARIERFHGSKRITKSLHYSKDSFEMWTLDEKDAIERAVFTARGSLNGSTGIPHKWTYSLRFDLAIAFVLGVTCCTASNIASDTHLWQVGVGTGVADFAIGTVAFRSRELLAEARMWICVVVGGDLPETYTSSALVALATFVAAPPLIEEFIFRGPLVALSSNGDLNGPLYAAWIVSAVLFAVAHRFDSAAAARSVAHGKLRALYAAKSALAYGYLAICSRSLYPSIVAHAVHNGLLCVYLCSGSYQRDDGAYAPE